MQVEKRLLANIFELNRKESFLKEGPMVSQTTPQHITIPRTMHSAVLEQQRTISLREVAVPEPGPGEALVRLRAVGICGSDVHYYVDGRIGDAVVKYPYVLGHEPSGEIAALGPGVQHLKVGDRVALEPARSCGVCQNCLAGRPNCCPQVRFLGSPPVAGVYEEYHIFPEHLCVPIPDSISLETAAVLEPLAVGVHAVAMSRLRLGDRVVVMGCGPVGILTAKAARAAGATFIAMTDIISDRRAHAARMVADVVFDTNDSEVAQQVKSVSEIDIAFEAAGVQEAVDDATLCVRPGGAAVIIGIPTVDRISIWAHQLRRKELNILMSRRSNFDLLPAIRLLVRGLINPAGVVTHRFPLARLAEGMEMVHNVQDGVLKAMIIM